jgi:hypothetical protein
MKSPLFTGHSHYFLHPARFALPSLSGSVLEVELAALPSASERDRCGCWRRDVECQLAPGPWTLDSKLQTSGPDGVVLHPQHFAHLVHQLELGIGNHQVRQRTHSRGLRAGNRKSIIFDMKLQDIEQEALGLGESERAELVLSLMRTLAAPAEDITDEEVFRRDAELETGSVEPMLHDEFVRRVREERGR